MKSIILLILAAGCVGAATLQDIRTVYIFPMRNGLDQYLASALTQEHVFSVVTDPKAADAVFTDRTGASFEQAFNQRVLEAKPKSDEEVHQSSFGGKGALFLVSKSKQVVWSTLDTPKDASAKQLARAAHRSVEKLKKDLNPKPMQKAS